MQDLTHKINKFFEHQTYGHVLKSRLMCHYIVELLGAKMRRNVHGRHLLYHLCYLGFQASPPLPHQCGKLRQRRRV